MALIIRPERPADREAIAELNRAAFGGAEEAELVDRLRDGPKPIISIVATDGADVVGHIMFSPLAVEIDGRRPIVLALAPMAVAPDRQRSGIGSRLVRAGLHAAREAGAEAVFVLGHRAFYPRFGFSAVLAARFKAAYSGPSFMALELVPGALAGSGGTVTYPAAFGPAGG